MIAFLRLSKENCTNLSYNLHSPLPQLTVITWSNISGLQLGSEPFPLFLMCEACEEKDFTVKRVGRSGRGQTGGVL